MDGPTPAERNAMAQRLISRKRLPEALDLLNETIRQDPRLAATFETRAIAFEAMGMLPQAEADRLKAASLRAAQTPVTPPPPAPPPPPEPPVTPTPAASPPEPEDAALAAALLSDKASEGDEVAAAESAAEEEDASDPVEEAAAASDAAADPPDEPPPPVLPAYQPPPRSFGSGLLRAAGVVFFALAVFLIAGLGIYFALNEVGGSSDDGTSAPTASPASSETEPGDDGSGASGASGASGDGSDVPPTVDEALAGSPYSFSHLEDAWHAQALAVSIGEISETVTGFAEPGVDITLTGNGEVMELSVLIYPSTEAKDADWTIGAAPAPKADGTVPAGSSIWYNANTIVVVRVSAPALRQDALDGFLSLGGTPPQESTPQESTPQESPAEE